MDASQDQTNQITENASTESSALGQSHELLPPDLHGESSERKHNLGDESILNESSKTSSAISEHVVNIQSAPEGYLSKDSSIEQAGQVPSPGDAVEYSKNEVLASTPYDLTKSHGDENVVTNFSSDGVALHHEELSQNHCKPDEKTRNSGVAGLGSCFEDANNNSEQKELPPEYQIKCFSGDPCGPPPQDTDPKFTPEHLNLSDKNIMEISKHKGSRENRTAKLLKRKYILRSSVSSDCILNSRSQDKLDLSGPSNNGTSVKCGQRRKRKKKKHKKIMANEFSRIITRLRYLLNRISYEKSLIDAYSGEGWKGQSLEKLKPEKELQRAKAEILQRKLKIRDLFQQLDSLCSDGRHPESLFDSEGQICSEDIFCAKCGSRDTSANNDIILCDGACDRAFHQFCLEPPLRKEEIPPDDEGWLCPGCDCKVDCVDLLNECQGTNLSVNDSWEKVFPEAVAAAAGGNTLDDSIRFPSDDSEDSDFDPDNPVVDDKDQREYSSSEEANFTRAHGDVGAPSNEVLLTGLTSDSEDDNYNPDAPDCNQGEKSSSSDFTSDSEDFGAVLDNDGSLKEGEGLMSGPVECVETSGGSAIQASEMGGKKSPSLNNEPVILVGDKRHVERLDYKKLYDETYGNASSSSSGDEEWVNTPASRKRSNFSTDIASIPSAGTTPVSRKGKKSRVRKKNLKTTEDIPRRTTHQKLKPEDTNDSPEKSCNGSSEPNTSGKRASSSGCKRIGEAATQKLYTSFKENPYPSRLTKEKFAGELGLTFRQVGKWFENARWCSRQTSKKEAGGAGSGPTKDSVEKDKVPDHGVESTTRESKDDTDSRENNVAAGESGKVNSSTAQARKRKGKREVQTGIKPRTRSRKS